ncbi:MAG: L-methionine (R)-S-oxide reductase [Thermotogaceae bacterium]|jgi:GAF domain-containing protein|nr:L-methionine (R)-S-oxide reductase [Thermotogaceae bacterium]
MEKEKLFEKLAWKLAEIFEETKDSKELLEKIVRLLSDNVEYYNWVGFYLNDGEKLVLGPFVGEPTIHVEIPYGKGICGQAAVTKQTFLVEDVTKETNYLSCSPKVKSEIVVPIMKGDKFIGELDIDSHTLNAFDEIDRRFLEKICEKLAERLDIAGDCL